MTKCTVEDCTNTVIVARSMCSTHYKRWQRHGHTTSTRPDTWGLSEKHPLYKMWCGMRRRCDDTKCKSYLDYGGRGIKVCSRWYNFWYFVEDMGERPTRSHQIDRIDNDKGYFPGNCRWATPKQQARNRRNTILTEDLAKEIRRRREYGDRMCDIARSLNLTYHTVENVVRNLCWLNN